MDVDAECAALTARVAALSSGDAPAVLDALAALAAPAYALRQPGSDGDGDGSGAPPGHAVWLPWIKIVARGLLTEPLCHSLAPLLLDERFTDAALALVVPLTAVLTLAAEAYEVQASAAWQAVLEAMDSDGLMRFLLDAFAGPLITLLQRGVECVDDDAAAGAAAATRTERVLRALCDCAHWEHDLAAVSDESVLCVRQPELRGALVALLRRPSPADGRPNVLAGAAAHLLVYLSRHNGFWSDQPAVTARDVALLRAALAALQDTWSDVRLPAWGGFSYGCDDVLHASPPRALLALLSSAMDDPETTQVVGTCELTKLILPQPGALAAVVRAAVWTSDAALLEELTIGVSEAPARRNAHSGFMLMADALCHSAMLDAELCLGELLSPHFNPPRDHDYSEVAVQARFLHACSDVASLELLVRPPRGAELPAAVTLALLAPRLPAAAAALSSSDALRTLARAYCRACASPPWRAAGLQWRDAAALQQRHARLRCALGAAAAFARTAPQQQRPQPDDAPPAKRLRAGAALLTASDVNVRRHDSVTLLVSGEPLYVNSMLLERVSPLLSDLISGVAATSAAPGSALAPVAVPVAVPAPADVAPDAFHALMCAAVAHTYTGELPPELPQASLLPLWCVARQLQMDELRAACAEALSPAALRAAPNKLLSRAADVALRHGCDAALLANAAAALLLAAPALGEEDDALVADALMCDDRGGGEHVDDAAADALGDAMAALMRDALLRRA
jgi:hypothetical protein